jgi:hypothetical protein
LSGLLLGEEEFDRHFAPHRDRLSVHRSGRAFVVSAKSGDSCPHWGAGGCRIYRERPIDCRVFPYVLFRIIDRGKSVRIVFHDRSDCPHKDQLFLQIPEGEVTALLLAFGKMLYDDGRAIVVVRETGIFSRLRTRVEAAVWRRLRGNRPA